MGRWFGHILAAVLSSISLGAEATEAWKQPTAPGANISSKDAAVVAQPAGQVEQIRRILAGVKLPHGFKIEFYAVVPGARHMAVSPHGDVVFVGTRMSRAYAVTVPPGSREASVKEFAGTIAKRMPNGPCMAADGVLYLVEQNRVLRFRGADRYFSGEDVAVEAIVSPGELIPPALQSFRHSARVCRVGPDDKLYISLGEPYNVTPMEKLAEFDRAGIGGIIRMDRDGRNREVFARGIRNCVGLDFNPADRTLWFTDNQVDGMGDDQPPGELNRASAPHQNFGFPWYGGGHVRTAEYRNQSPPAGLVFPMVEEAAHAADLGLTFYSGRAFPKKYHGGIFSAQHGSWNRSTPVGARVMFTPLKPDGTADHSDVFAEGWLSPAGQYLGRPVDVAQLPDGSLLVSDDEAGALYRIVYAGQ